MTDPNAPYWTDEDPPLTSEPPTRSVYDEWAEKVRQDPEGKWLVLPNKSRNTPGYLRAKYPDLEIRGVDHRVDERGSKRCDVWMRRPRRKS